MSVTVDNPRNSCCYDIPTAGIFPRVIANQGESFRHAALRETEEETGIPAREIRLDDGFAFKITYPVTLQGDGVTRRFEKQVRYFSASCRYKPI